MQFIKINDVWWEVEGSPHNYSGGSYPTLTCKSWHELYLLIHYNPLAATVEDENLWISPSGEIFNGDGHSAMADEIVELVYGLTDIVNGEYILEQYGWIKISYNFWLFNIIYGTNEEWKMTQQQANVVFDWCKKHDRSYPIENIIIQDKQ